MINEIVDCYPKFLYNKVKCLDFTCQFQLAKTNPLVEGIFFIFLPLKLHLLYLDNIDNNFNKHLFILKAIQGRYIDKM